MPIFKYQIPSESTHPSPDCHDGWGAQLTHLPLTIGVWVCKLNLTIGVQFSSLNINNRCWFRCRRVSGTSTWGWLILQSISGRTILFWADQVRLSETLCKLDIDILDIESHMTWISPWWKPCNKTTKWTCNVLKIVVDKNILKKQAVFQA